MFLLWHAGSVEGSTGAGVRCTVSAIFCLFSVISRVELAGSLGGGLHGDVNVATGSGIRSLMLQYSIVVHVWKSGGTLERRHSRLRLRVVAIAHRLPLAVGRTLYVKSSVESDTNKLVT